MTDRPTVVLAFSGGLDTSFCVPWLIEHGYDVITLFVDTGGVTVAEVDAIRDRAMELGAIEHVNYDASQELWDEFVVPFVMCGARYQDQYPLLCSDRYVIAAAMVELAAARGTRFVAHGCTAMGNDQVRFDQSLRCLGDVHILAPIREIQKLTATPRQYEREYLEVRGFAVPAKMTHYTMNENLLGVTFSGSEIDDFLAPGPGTWHMTAPPAQWPTTPSRHVICFESGVPTSLDDATPAGPQLLRSLNRSAGRHGIGRGVYTGDTVIGLKGRIVYEGPGLIALLTAHRALEECILSRAQNSFKPLLAHKWTELAYQGFYFEPLRFDLEAAIRSMQQFVTGAVTLEFIGGTCHAVAVDTPHKLTRAGATYAQGADWSAEQAEGFIRLFGQSAAISAAVNPVIAVRQGASSCCPTS